MLRQHDDGFVVEQPGLTRFVQIRGEFQVHQVQALIIARRQVRLDAKQVAVVIVDAVVDRQLDAQIGQVVAHLALLGPEPVTGGCGDQSDEQGAAK